LAVDHSTTHTLKTLNVDLSCFAVMGENGYAGFVLPDQKDDTQPGNGQFPLDVALFIGQLDRRPL
jgi:hypothetical protein